MLAGGSSPVRTPASEAATPVSKGTFKCFLIVTNNGGKILGNTMLCLRRTINVLPRETRYDGQAGCASASLLHSTCRDVAPRRLPWLSQIPSFPKFIHLSPHVGFGDIT